MQAQRSAKQYARLEKKLLKPKLNSPPAPKKGGKAF